MLSTVVACLHSLVAVQVLVLCAFLTPNQDLAFVAAVSYDVLSSLLAGVWVYIGNMVRTQNTHMLPIMRCRPEKHTASC